MIKITDSASSEKGLRSAVVNKTDYISTSYTRIDEIYAGQTLVWPIYSYKLELISDDDIQRDTVSNRGASYTIKVYSYRIESSLPDILEWEPNYTGLYDDWVHVTGPKNKTVESDGKITYEFDVTVDENDKTTSTRSTTFYIVNGHSPNIRIDISQDARSSSLSASKKDVTLNNIGSGDDNSETLTVTSTLNGSNTSWSASKSDSFFDITTTSSTIKISATGNNDTDSVKTGSVTLSNGYADDYVINVTQSAGSIVLSASPDSVTLPNTTSSTSKAQTVTVTSTINGSFTSWHVSAKSGDFFTYTGTGNSASDKLTINTSQDNTGGERSGYIILANDYTTYNVSVTQKEAGRSISTVPTNITLGNTAGSEGSVTVTSTYNGANASWRVSATSGDFFTVEPEVGVDTTSTTLKVTAKSTNTGNVRDGSITLQNDTVECSVPVKQNAGTLSYYLTSSSFNTSSPGHEIPASGVTNNTFTIDSSYTFNNTYAYANVYVYAYPSTLISASGPNRWPNNGQGIEITYTIYPNDDTSVQTSYIAFTQKNDSGAVTNYKASYFKSAGKPVVTYTSYYMNLIAGDASNTVYVGNSPDTNNRVSSYFFAYLGADQNELTLGGIAYAEYTYSDDSKVTGYVSSHGGQLTGEAPNIPGLDTTGWIGMSLKYKDGHYYHCDETSYEISGIIQFTDVSSDENISYSQLCVRMPYESGDNGKNAYLVNTVVIVRSKDTWTDESVVLSFERGATQYSLDEFTADQSADTRGKSVNIISYKKQKNSKEQYRYVPNSIEVSTEETWISFNTQPMQIGSDTSLGYVLSGIKVATNTNTEPRTGTITITADHAAQPITINITQKGADIIEYYWDIESHIGSKIKVTESTSIFESITSTCKINDKTTYVGVEVIVDETLDQYIVASYKEDNYTDDSGANAVNQTIRIYASNDFVEPDKAVEGSITFKQRGKDNNGYSGKEYKVTVNISEKKISYEFKWSDNSTSKEVYVPCIGYGEIAETIADIVSTADGVRYTDIGITTSSNTFGSDVIITLDKTTAGTYVPVQISGTKLNPKGDSDRICNVTFTQKNSSASPLTLKIIQRPATDYILKFDNSTNKYDISTTTAALRQTVFINCFVLEGSTQIRTLEKPTTSVDASATENTAFCGVIGDTPDGLGFNLLVDIGQWTNNTQGKTSRTNIINITHPYDANLTAQIIVEQKDTQYVFKWADTNEKEKKIYIPCIGYGNQSQSYIIANIISTKNGEPYNNVNNVNSNDNDVKILSSAGYYGEYVKLSGTSDNLSVNVTINNVSMNNSTTNRPETTIKLTQNGNTGDELTLTIIQRRIYGYELSFNNGSSNRYEIDTTRETKEIPVLVNCVVLEDGGDGIPSGTSYRTYDKPTISYSNSDNFCGINVDSITEVPGTTMFMLPLRIDQNATISPRERTITITHPYDDSVTISIIVNQSTMPEKMFSISTTGTLIDGTEQRFTVNVTSWVLGEKVPFDIDIYDITKNSFEGEALKPCAWISIETDRSEDTGYWGGGQSGNITDLTEINFKIYENYVNENGSRLIADRKAQITFTQLNTGETKNVIITQRPITETFTLYVAEEITMPGDTSSVRIYYNSFSDKRAYIPVSVSSNKSDFSVLGEIQEQYFVIQDTDINTSGADKTSQITITQDAEGGTSKAITLTHKALTFKEAVAEKVNAGELSLTCDINFTSDVITSDMFGDGYAEVDISNPNRMFTGSQSTDETDRTIHLTSSTATVSYNNFTFDTVFGNNKDGLNVFIICKDDTDNKDFTRSWQVYGPYTATDDSPLFDGTINTMIKFDDTGTCKYNFFVVLSNYSSEDSFSINASYNEAVDELYNDKNVYVLLNVNTVLNKDKTTIIDTTYSLEVDGLTDGKSVTANSTKIQFTATAIDTTKVDGVVDEDLTISHAPIVEFIENNKPVLALEWARILQTAYNKFTLEIEEYVNYEDSRMCELRITNQRVNTDTATKTYNITQEPKEKTNAKYVFTADNTSINISYSAKTIDIIVDSYIEKELAKKDFGTGGGIIDEDRDIGVAGGLNSNSSNGISTYADLSPGGVSNGTQQGVTHVTTKEYIEPNIDSTDGNIDSLSVTVTQRSNTQAKISLKINENGSTEKTSKITISQTRDPDDSIKVESEDDSPITITIIQSKKPNDAPSSDIPNKYTNISIDNINKADSRDDYLIKITAEYRGNKKEQTIKSMSTKDFTTIYLPSINYYSNDPVKLTIEWNAHIICSPDIMPSESYWVMMVAEQLYDTNGSLIMEGTDDKYYVIHDENLPKYEIKSVSGDNPNTSNLTLNYTLNYSVHPYRGQGSSYPLYQLFIPANYNGYPVFTDGGSAEGLSYDAYTVIYEDLGLLPSNYFATGKNTVLGFVIDFNSNEEWD